MSEDTPSVLVVEDEADLADLYAAWLGEEYDVRTAYGGQEAMDQLSPDVDVILLDRRMPGMSGDEVLVAVREEGVDARVAMVTAVEPDFDIVEMGFDDYLVKPVTRESLTETVEGLLQRSRYDEGVQELYAVASKKAVLEAEKGQAALQDSEEYAELDERMDELNDQLDHQMDSFDSHDDFEKAFRQFDTDDDDDDDEELDFGM